ncbi:MAG: hypothetical protein ABIL01_27435, partial [Pseudomonadota bacterium]
PGDVNDGPRSRGVLDRLLEPVIELAGGETRWRGDDTVSKSVLPTTSCAGTRAADLTLLYMGLFS